MCERLKKYAILKSTVSWSMFWLEHNASADCSDVLTKEEWTLLYRKIHKTRQVPKKTPTLSKCSFGLQYWEGTSLEHRIHHPGSLAFGVDGNVCLKSLMIIVIFMGKARWFPSAYAMLIQSANRYFYRRHRPLHTN